MSTTSSWQQSISFSERLEHVLAIGGALAQRPSTDGSKPDAQGLESNIFSIATSLDDYNTQCLALRQHLSQSAKHSESLETLEAGNRFQHSDDSGTTIGPYTCAVYHRDGVTSTVYKARRLPNQKDTSSATSDFDIALKVVNSTATAAPHDVHKEIRILRKLKHSNIIPLQEVMQTPVGIVLESPFLLYDVPKLLSAGGTWSQDQRCRCLADVLSALAYLHSLGIIHRDVKPSNILLSNPSGPAVLIDFGIAWDPNDASSEPANEKITDVGTTCYRPPELLFGDTSYDSSLDMWAFGCVAAEILAGKGGSLFDAGDLGSELALIRSIFQKLGTPTLETWPGAAKLRDWGRLQFHNYPPQDWTSLLPEMSPLGRDLVSKLLLYESNNRLSAQEALEHPLFERIS